MVVISFFNINFYKDFTMHENKYLNTSQIIPTLNPFQNSLSLCHLGSPKTMYMSILNMFKSFKKMYQRSGDLIYWGSIVGYINHIISFNPLKCLVERESLSPFGKEYTESCSAIATRLESRQAENRIHLFGLKAYLLFQLYHIVF